MGNDGCPRSEATGEIRVVFNGEIYNHRDIRRELEARGHVYRTQCDTEAIVHGYEEWGDGVVERLRGMFAFAVLGGEPGLFPRSGPARDQTPLLHASGRPPHLRVGDQGDPGMARRGEGGVRRGSVSLPDAVSGARASDDVPRHPEAAAWHDAVGRARREHRDAALLGADAQRRRVRFPGSRRPGRRAQGEASRVDPPAHDERRALWGVPQRRRRFKPERRSDERADGPAGRHVLDSDRGRSGVRRAFTGSAGRASLRHESPRGRGVRASVHRNASRDGPSPGRASGRPGVRAALSRQQAGAGERDDRRPGGGGGRRAFRRLRRLRRDGGPSPPPVRAVRGDALVDQAPGGSSGAPPAAGPQSRVCPARGLGGGAVLGGAPRCSPSRPSAGC